MFKRFGSILIVVIMITVFYMTAFAGNTEGFGGIEPSVAGNPAVVNASGAGSGIAGESVVFVEEETEEDKARKLFDGEYESALRNGTALDNGQFIMTITKPENDRDSTYKRSYILSGKSDYDDVVISIARLNRDTGRYELIQNTDGDSSWGIGSGIFSTEILLNNGVNNLMFLSYRKSEMIEGKIQFNSVTVELLPESLSDKVTRKVAEIGKSIAQGIERMQIEIDIFGRKAK